MFSIPLWWPYRHMCPIYSTYYPGEVSINPEPKIYVYFNFANKVIRILFYLFHFSNIYCSKDDKYIINLIVLFLNGLNLSR